MVISLAVYVKATKDTKLHLALDLMADWQCKQRSNQPLYPTAVAHDVIKLLNTTLSN